MRYMYVLKNIGIDVTMQIIKKSIKKKYIIHYINDVLLKLEFPRLD